MSRLKFSRACNLLQTPHPPFDEGKMPAQPVVSLILAAVVVTTVPLAAQTDAQRWLERCQRDDWGTRARACQVRETGMRPAAGALTVDPDQNGGVSVFGWNRDSVAVIARIQAGARSEADARRLADGVTVEAAAGTIRAQGPSTGQGEDWSVSFDVYVPQRSDLAIETVNGPLSVEAVSGTLRLQARNGPLSLTDVGGDVQARVQNGPLSVELSGERWQGTGLDAESRNGPVALAVPEHYNAELETGTVNGPMDLGFPLTVTVHGRLSRRIHATLGEGGAPVRVVTTNGPLTVRRAR
jgi:hypothetical protein